MTALAKRFTRGNEVRLTDAIQKARLIVAVKNGDIADVRYLVECQGKDIHAKDSVCWFCFDVSPSIDSVMIRFRVE